MKIYINNLRPNMSPYNGKGKFVQRLAKELRTRKGVEIVDKPKHCDINFRLNTMPDTDYGKRIVRLNGFNFTLKNSKDIDKDKNDFRKTLLTADGIIYQSMYAKDLLINYLGYDGDENNPYRIIPNGLDPYHFRAIKDINLNKKRQH